MEKCEGVYLNLKLIGSIIGTIEGVMPGAGGTIASFMSYNEARRWSRFKSEFGNGSPEGIAAPETANNTVAFDMRLCLY